MVDLPHRARLALAGVATAVGVAVMAGVPLYYWWYAPNFVAGYSDPSNTAMFLGSLGALVGLAIMATGGQDLYGEWSRRQRFEDLVDSRRKSDLMKNLGELEEMAGRLPKRYRERLEKVKAEYGLD